MSEEIFISKLSFDGTGCLIEGVVSHYLNNGQLTYGKYQNRTWLLNQYLTYTEIWAINKNEKGEWIRSQQFTYLNGNFGWSCILPKILPKRKVFVSYYHSDDQMYRNIFENHFSDLIISKSVQIGDIEPDNSSEYIKSLIQESHLSDTTILVVLVGNRTRYRKHIDWEISGALNWKVGNSYAGLIGITLPTHPNYNCPTYNEDLYPERLVSNQKSNYAQIYNWSLDRIWFQNIIEDAYSRRAQDSLIVNAEIEQLKRNIRNG